MLQGLQMLRVLFVHNSYLIRGGEDVVVEAEVSLLSNNGNMVLLAVQKNKAINSFYSKIKVFFNVAYSIQFKNWMSDKISEHKPDVVHVHNFFPLLSPSIYDACIDAGVPVVQTLHNYRAMCPGGLLMRDGVICEKCVTGSSYQSVLHSCYRSSVAGTFAVARMVEKHRGSGTWQYKVNRFIALTKFARDKFIEAGFPANKIIVKPYFTVDSDFLENKVRHSRKGGLFVGRLSHEKGLGTLLNAWETLDVPLKVAGSGPLETRLSDIACNGIKMLGTLDKNSVQQEMQQAAFLVMPSECYETFGLVIIEAFSQGLPVITSRLGGMAEIVEDGVTGLHFEAGNADDLAEKVEWISAHTKEREQMGRNARQTYLKNYTPEINYKQLMAIYQEAIDEA